MKLLPIILILVVAFGAFTYFNSDDTLAILGGATLVSEGSNYKCFMVNDFDASSISYGSKQSYLAEYPKNAIGWKVNQVTDLLENNDWNAYAEYSVTCGYNEGAFDYSNPNINPSESGKTYLYKTTQVYKGGSADRVVETQESFNFCVQDTRARKIYFDTKICYADEFTNAKTKYNEVFNGVTPLSDENVGVGSSDSVGTSSEGFIYKLNKAINKVILWFKNLI